MAKIVAHKAQAVLVSAGTIIEDDKGTEDTVTEDRGVQIGNTFFMTLGAWEETASKDADLRALVLKPAA